MNQKGKITLSTLMMNMEGRMGPREAAGRRRQDGKVISTLFLLKAIVGEIRFRATSQIQGQLPDIECYKVNNLND